MRATTDSFDSPAGPAARLWQRARRLWCRHRQVIATSSKADGAPARVVCSSCGWHEPVLTPTPRDTRRDTPASTDWSFEIARRRRAALAEQRQRALRHLAPDDGVELEAATPRRAAVVHIRPASGE